MNSTEKSLTFTLLLPGLLLIALVIYRSVPQSRASSYCSRCGMFGGGCKCPKGKCGCGK